VFNLRKESLLFDDNATTRQDNNVQRFWNVCQSRLPYVVHGSSSSRSSKNSNTAIDPVAALYNMVFVRLPVIAAGVVYWYNLIIAGHPLIVDLGIVVGDNNGALEVPPLLVGCVLWIILR